MFCDIKTLCTSVPSLRSLWLSFTTESHGGLHREHEGKYYLYAFNKIDF
jgi:hypothetical protein